MIGVLIAAALSIYSEPPAAAFLTGNQLLAFCDQGERDLSSEYLCLGYVAGAVDAVRATEAALDDLLGKPGLICVPASVTPRQVRDVTVERLRSSPTTRHFGASSLVLEAMMEAYPCLTPDR